MARLDRLRLVDKEGSLMAGAFTLLLFVFMAGMLLGALIVGLV